MPGKAHPFATIGSNSLMVANAKPSVPQSTRPDIRARVAQEADAIGPAPVVEVSSIGTTMFDRFNADDNTITVLLPLAEIAQAPTQALLRIKSEPDGRAYLGVVSAGPFSQPDSMSPDSSVLVSVAVHRGEYMPPYHGRIQVTLLGEELPDGTIAPHRLRPRPNSPVYRLSDEETARVLHTEGDIRIGLAVGYEHVEVRVPSTSKSVLPRHTAILGTTGGGKSTTVAGLIKEAQSAGMAVIVLDVEGEYTFLHQPTDDARMKALLAERHLPAAGLTPGKMTLWHLVGRKCANPSHPHIAAFSIQLAMVSPYALMEILEMSDAQKERFHTAYDVAKGLLRDLKIFPTTPEQERLALEYDEFDRGYPRMTLTLLIDVVEACIKWAETPAKDKKKGAKTDEEEDLYASLAQKPFRNKQLRESADGRKLMAQRLAAANPAGHPVSWRALLGKLLRLSRLGVFYEDDLATGKSTVLNYRKLLEPGRVSVVDLSESGHSELNNIVIADILRGVQDAQDDIYKVYEGDKDAGKEAASPPRVLIIIEEAHEFLSEERIERTKVLFQQVARIAKRGRKRWLSLAFVTQLPQHLPRQIFGLVNSYIVHKITDPHVAATLQRTISGIDESLWRRLGALAPGQALVSFPHMTRPMLASIDPASAKLRLVD